MSRYIDVDALLKAINKNTAEAHNERCAQLLEAILYAPTADVVEVVRCKDCAYYREENGYCMNSHCASSFYGHRVKEEHYCSYGERRTE